MSEDHSIASTSRPGSPAPPLPESVSARPYRFAWDSVRKSGPSSVSGASETRGDYFAYKPSLGSINFSSTSLALGSIPPEWSSSRYGFNAGEAISTLVNHPHKKSAPPKAHAPVPPIIPSQLPRVRRKDFNSYLKAIAPEWEQYTKALLTSHESQLPILSSPLSPTDDEPSDTPKLLRNPAGSFVPPLGSVPSVFFDPLFDLSNAPIFAIVTEQGDGEEVQDPAALSHSLPLLEKLSHYADTIELHLIHEISQRSSSFFAALSNFNELQTESEQCLERIRHLKAVLLETDEKNAKKGLDIIKREKKLSNLRDLKEAVKAVRNVKEMLTLARSLTSAGEWEEALNLIEGLHGMWDPKSLHQAQQEDGLAQKRSSFQSQSRLLKRNSVLLSMPKPESISEELFPDNMPSTELSSLPFPVPLSALNLFKKLPEQLSALTLEITSSLTSELVSALQTDLIAQMELPPLPTNNPENVSTDDILSQVDPARSDRLSCLCERLRPLSQGLRRTNGFRDAIQKWRETALAEIRLSLRKHLPSLEELDDEFLSSMVKDSQRAASLRNQLNSMEHNDFIRLMRSVYGTLLSGIQELQTQNAILTEILQSTRSENSAVDIPAVQTDLSDIVSSTTELAHSRAAAILNTRAEQHAALDLPTFLEVFSGTWDFVVRTETICRRMVVGLRSVIISQAKGLLLSVHQNRITQSAKLVEDEQWSVSDVSRPCQATVNIIVDSAVGDPPGLVISRNSEPSNDVNKPVPLTSLAKHLLIEDRKYFAVSATLQTLGLLIDYLKIITSIPLLATDTVGRVIEFLKAFNSRTCQVVLGAGAMRSAGLKNITAKHLALASQSLSIVIALIPYVRECFRRRLNAKQAVMLVEFDKLKRDYQEHQQEIHLKLIAIMSDRLNAHCKSLQAVEWSQPLSTVNDYMTLLVKETVTLHKVLSRYLQEGVVEFVMTQIFAAINHRLAEEYGKLILPDQDAKSRLMADAKYLNESFSGLKYSPAPAGMLETVIAEKQVAQTQDTSINGSGTRSSEADKPSTRQTQPHPSSTLGTTSERLRGIFRRSPVNPPADLRTASIPQSQTPMSPLLEKQSTGPLVVSVQPLETTAQALLPPENDSWLGNVEGLEVSPPSPRLTDRPRSPLLDRVLPIPVPTLDAEGNIVDALESACHVPAISPPDATTERPTLGTEGNIIDAPESARHVPAIPPPDSATELSERPASEVSQSAPP